MVWYEPTKPDVLEQNTYYYLLAIMDPDGIQSPMWH